MRNKLWSLLLLLPIAAFIAGCPTADDDDSSGDGDNPDPDVVITEANPDPQDPNNFYFRSDIWVRFDRVPDMAEITVTQGGTAIDGSTAESSGGTVLTFTPAAPLIPSTDYELTIHWMPNSAGDLTYAFQTGPYGNELATPEATLVDSTYNIDLAAATFVEPPGIGPILQSQIGDIAILFMPTADSNFVAGELQILGALGEVTDPVNNTVIQTDCTETLAFTEQEPAVFDNPDMSVGPTDLEISIAGVSATINDLNITGTFHPDGTDMRGGTFAGSVDTRPLVDEIEEGGDDDAVCVLVEETIGVECEPCNDDGTEPFCLSLLAEDIVAERITGLVLEMMTCVDIITHFEASVDCGGDMQPDCDCSDATDYDADGDGVYELCPAYVP